MGAEPTFVHPRPDRPGMPLTMVGTPGDDVFFGAGGDVNVMYGMGGNDCFIGGPTRDIMFGGTGDDVMIPRWGGSVLFSAGGNDTVVSHLGDAAVAPPDDGVPAEEEVRPRWPYRCFGFPAATPGCWSVEAAPEPGSIFDVEGLRIRRDGQLAERLWRLAVGPRTTQEWPGFDGGPFVIRG